jgi:hypothetical protein
MVIARNWIASGALTDIASTMAGIASTKTEIVLTWCVFASSKSGFVSTKAEVALSHAGEVSRVPIQQRHKSILSRPLRR